MTISAMRSQMLEHNFEVGDAQTLDCLHVWAQLIERTGEGKLTISRNGSNVEVTVTPKKGDPKILSVVQSPLLLINRYKCIEELITEVGSWDVGHYYDAKLVGVVGTEEPITVELDLSVVLRKDECGDQWQEFSAKISRKDPVLASKH